MAQTLEDICQRLLALPLVTIDGVDYVRSSDIVQAWDPPADAHEHTWIDVRNEAVISGEVCFECGEWGEGNDSTTPENFMRNFLAASIKHVEPTCLERNPDASLADYHPSCCRFPKSCSAVTYCTLPHIDGMTCYVHERVHDGSTDDLYSVLKDTDPARLTLAGRRLRTALLEMAS